MLCNKEENRSPLDKQSSILFLIFIFLTSWRLIVKIFNPSQWFCGLVVKWILYIFLSLSLEWEREAVNIFLVFVCLCMYICLCVQMCVEEERVFCLPGTRMSISKYNSTYVCNSVRREWGFVDCQVLEWIFPSTSSLICTVFYFKIKKNKINDTEFQNKTIKY